MNARSSSLRQPTAFECQTEAGDAVQASLVSKGKKDFSDTEVIYIYNVLFKKVMSSLEMVQMNRNFYMPSRAKRIPAHK